MDPHRHLPRGPLRSKAGIAKRAPARYSNDGANDPELRRALRLHRAASYAEAADLYRRVLVRDPEALDAWMNLGGACVRLGRAQEAAGALLRSVALGAHDPRVQRDAAKGFAALGAWSNARSAYERALSLDAKMIGARLGVARLCLETGDREAALHHAERAVADAPHDASSWVELHRARFDAAALGPAIDAAARAVELRPDYATARLFLGGALLWAGARQRGRDVLRGGTLDRGLVDAVTYCERHRGSALATASKHQTLLFARDCATLDGPIVELGVRHGVSTRLLAARPAARVHAFDCFFGLPTRWHDKPRGAFTTNGETPAVPANVTFHVGLFEDTLPPFAASLRESPSLLHVDSDLHASAATALSVLGPHLAPGTVLLFDEYLGNSHWRNDEHRALEEATAGFSWSFDVVALSWITGQLCVRLTKTV